MEFEVSDTPAIKHYRLEAKKDMVEDDSISLTLLGTTKSYTVPAGKKVTVKINISLTEQDI